MVHQTETQGDGASEQSLDVRAIRRALSIWYRRHKRDLPWRQTQDPYRIWISEIMLQQTRVAAVVPYYERFLRLFPTPEALAAAPERELLAAWAGLGYYSRARNLQKAARRMVESKSFPSDYAALRDMPGIGDYTAAAVASIAFGRPHAVVDGNVLRVLSRLLCEHGNIKSDIVRKRLRDVAQELLDRKRPGEFNQALMELGATVCVPKQPRCLLCPIAGNCQARGRGLQEELPVSGARPVAKRQERHLLIIEKPAGILLWQYPPDSKRLAGFWELPERAQLPRAKLLQPLCRFRHTIVNTAYDVEVSSASLRSEPKTFLWLPKSSLGEYPLTTITRKALACFHE